MPWHCHVCGKLILQREHDKAEVMRAIRHHYEKYHPQKFKGFAKKGARTKKRRQEEPW